MSAEARATRSANSTRAVAGIALLALSICLGGCSFSLRSSERSTPAVEADRRVAEPDGQLDPSTLPDDAVLASSIVAGMGGGAVIGDDYPYKNLPQDSKFDPWREYVRECTSFAAWALHSRNGFEMPFYANARDWGAKAASRGFRVDSSPAVGAVAWSDAGKYGHVAWVAVVSGGSVTIEEYNQRGTGRYSSRTVGAGTYRYIHFKDLPVTSPAPAPPAAPAPAPVPKATTPASPSEGPAATTPPNRTGGGAPVTGPTGPPAPGAGPSSTSGTPRPTPAPTPTPTPAAPAHGPTPTVPPATSPPPARRTWLEQSGSHGSPTFQIVSNASGQGPTVPAMSNVEVSCKVRPASTIASAQPDGYWYRIHSAPWNDQYYAVANTFWNGDIPGHLPYVHNTDFAVPDC